MLRRQARAYKYCFFEFSGALEKRKRYQILSRLSADKCRDD